jgi:hypothetical protein
VYPSGLLVQGMRRMIRNKPNITLMATLYYLFLSFYATDRIVKVSVTVVRFWVCNLTPSLCDSPFPIREGGNRSLSIHK